MLTLSGIYCVYVWGIVNFIGYAGIGAYRAKAGGTYPPTHPVETRITQHFPVLRSSFDRLLDLDCLPIACPVGCTLLVYVRLAPGVPCSRRRCRGVLIRAYEGADWHAALSDTDTVSDHLSYYAAAGSAAWPVKRVRLDDCLAAKRPVCHVIRFLLT